MYPRIIFCALLILLITGKGAAQANNDVARAYERARIRLEKNFTELESFSSEGIARAVLDDSATYIDSSGKAIMPFKYSVRNFNEGLGAVAESGNGPCYYIDKTGKKVLDLPGYMVAFSFSNGYAVVENRQELYGIIDKTGKEVLPCIAGLWPIWLNGDYYIVDVEHEETKIVNLKGAAALPVKDFSLLYHDEVTGNYLMKKGEDYFVLGSDGAVKKKIGVSIYQLTEGQEGTYIIRKDKGSEFALMDGNGDLIVPYGTYNRIVPVGDGLLCVAVKTAVTTGGDGKNTAHYKAGFIDKTGKLVIPLQFENIFSQFNNGLAVAVQQGKKGFINKNGKWVITAQFDDAQGFNNGYAKVTTGAGETYYIDEVGRRVY